MATLKNPASDMAAALTGQTLGGVALTSGTNLFANEVPPNLTMAVSLLNGAGEKPQPYIAGSTDSIFRALVTGYVRGVGGGVGYSNSETLARAVLGYMHLKTVSGYVSVEAEHTHPDYMGPDEQGRPQWTFLLRCTYTA